MCSRKVIFPVPVGGYKLLNEARILLVDDEVLHLQSLQRTLQGYGCKVTSASSVPDALNAIASENVGFHAAVVDYMLLDRRGSEVVKALNVGERFTASVVLTGAPSKEMIDDVIELGVHETLTKPVRVNVLLRTVEAAVGKTINTRHLVHVATTELPALSDTAVVDSVDDDELTPSGGFSSISLARVEDRAADLADRGGLSDRERQVLVLVFGGDKNAQVASKLNIAERTVKFHIGNINKKLRVRNRGELMAQLAADAKPLSGLKPVNGVDHTQDGGSIADDIE